MPSVLANGFISSNLVGVDEAVLNFGADARLLTEGEEITHDVFARLTSKKTITGPMGLSPGLRRNESKASASNNQYIKDAFKDHVSRYERLGTYTSPDNEKLDGLIVHLTRESILERARTTIRPFVADHLKTRHVAGRPVILVRDAEGRCGSC